MSINLAFAIIHYIIHGGKKCKIQTSDDEQFPTCYTYLHAALCVFFYAGHEAISRVELSHLNKLITQNILSDSLLYSQAQRVHSRQQQTQNGLSDTWISLAIPLCSPSSSACLNFDNNIHLIEYYSSNLLLADKSMVSLGTSILLMVFVQAGIALTSTTTSQDSPAVNATTTIQVTKQADTATQGTTSTRSPFAMPSKESVSNEPDPVNYYLRLHLDLKVYLDFKDIYEDRSSPEFQSLATNFSVSLIQHFQYIKGFKSIDILQFSPGSVVVDYSVNVYATVDILAVTNQIENEVVDSLKEVAGAHVDIDYTRTSMKIRLESLRKRDKCSLASENLCPFGYYCKLAGTATLLCIDRCNVSVCENNGLCYIGHLSQDIQCKCPISDGAVFTGARCETKQVVMTIQERNLYLIIGGSILGAVIFSFVLTVCIINRKRRILKKKLSSINLRMKQDELHPTGIKYIRDEHDIYADGKETSINRQRQNIFDTTDNPFEGRIDQNVDDGYQRAVENLRGDDGYLRTAEGTRRKDDSEYDYIK
ncbi:hypothetical protein CHS0354_002265 [Potamilus streckersoni]|uniref:Interphotoreceptor matrix proteoglycan 2 n=1 Tax=Potamilus streckersoni TaxID=2493646 RepID=A0AAE0VNT7_9BIVA|nr:hypothetical protein CHS0354_002265 [Potamilus streckersoni]